MIKNFETETKPLTDAELALVTHFTCLLRERKGSAMALTNDRIGETIEHRTGSGHLSGSRVRKIINHIRTKGLVDGLIASSDGYYVATSEAELSEYIESLDGRLKAIYAVRRSIEAQRARLYPKQQPTLFPNL